MINVAKCVGEVERGQQAVAAGTIAEYIKVCYGGSMDRGVLVADGFPTYNRNRQRRMRRL